jgi:hypothetical protein
MHLKEDNREKGERRENVCSSFAVKKALMPSLAGREPG